MRKLASPSNTDTIETCDTEQRDRLRAPLRRHLKPLLNHSFPAAEIELGDAFLRKHTAIAQPREIMRLISLPWNPIIAGWRTPVRTATS
jgi:hypothetical protein